MGLARDSRDSTSFRPVSSSPPRAGIVLVNGLHLWCEERGSRADPTVVLVMGHGSQGIEYPERLCDRLAAAGRHVVRFDNRDAGESDDAVGPYTASDMADDIVGVCDALGVAPAHLVGCSLGGVLCQLAVAAHPDRFRTLTVLMSSTGGSGLPGEHARYARARVPAPGPSHDDRVAYVMRLWRAMNGGILPFVDAHWRPLVEEVVRRGWTVARIRRQLAAALVTAERGPDQRALRLPVLVVHGTADPVLPYPHGVAIAERTPGARLVTLPALGHLLHPMYLDRIADEVLVHSDG
jgi:pimeloyl-ACP methyl ester carboxylesterase